MMTCQVCADFASRDGEFLRGQQCRAPSSTEVPIVRVPARARLPRRALLATLAISTALRPCVAEAPASSEQAKRYSPAMARCMAALSKLAYCNPRNSEEVALDESCGMPCDWAGMELEPGSRILAHEARGTVDYGYVAKFKRSAEANQNSLPDYGCIVVLRGAEGEPKDPVLPGQTEVSPKLTASTLDVWESDVTCEGCQVSALYKSAWDLLKPRVEDHLYDAGCKPGADTSKCSLHDSGAGCGDAVFVTGHSRGAALATLAMFSLRSIGYSVQLSYSFASPKVGNLAFVKAFNSYFQNPVSMFRITNGNDRIPKEPVNKPDYVHAGFQVWYKVDDVDTNFVICGNYSSDPSCGIDGKDVNNTCPTKQEACSHNNTAPCPRNCKRWAPRGGPHCRNPLAPAKNFCEFSDNSTDNWGSEWNEVVKKSGKGLPWEGTCVWGAPPKPASVPRAADEAAVHQVEREAERSRDEAADEGTNTSKEINADEDATKVANKKMSCFQVDTLYQPLDMPGHAFTIAADAWACQLRCASLEGCAHFSFFRRGIDGDCHISDKNAHPQEESLGFVSGPQVCQEDKKKLASSQQMPPLISDRTFTWQWFFPFLYASGLMGLYFFVIVQLAGIGSKPSARRSGPAGDMVAEPFLSTSGFSNRTMDSVRRPEQMPVISGNSGV